jgi:hypothetical protein
MLTNPWSIEQQIEYHSARSFFRAALSQNTAALSQTASLNLI